MVTRWAALLSKAKRARRAWVRHRWRESRAKRRHQRNLDHPGLCRALAFPVVTYILFGIHEALLSVVVRKTTTGYGPLSAHSHATKGTPT